MFALKTVLGRRFESRHKLQTINRPNTDLCRYSGGFLIFQMCLKFRICTSKCRKNHTNAMKITRIVTRKLPSRITEIDTKLKTIIMLKECLWHSNVVEHYRLTFTAKASDMRRGVKSKQCIRRSQSGKLLRLILKSAISISM